MRDGRGIQSMLRRVPARLALAIAAMTLVTAAGVAYAATALTSATANDPFIVCVNDSNGEMRAVASRSACRPNETAFDLARASGPQSVTVDCAAGQKVNDVLAASANNPSLLTITIVGTCTEAVNVPRNDVVLRASAPGDGLAAPTAGSTVLSLSGVGIRLGQLRLSGGSNGLSVFNAAQFFANGLNVTGFANTGISVGGNSSGNLQSSTVDGGSEGVSVSGGSSLGFTGGAIRNSGTGASARAGGSLNLGGGAIVSDSSGHGIIAYPGGTIELQGIVRNSGNTGAYAFGGSISVGGNGTLIEGSRFGGLSAEDGGSVSLTGGARSTGNGVGVAANGGAVLIQDGGIVENNSGVGVQLMTGSTLRMRGGAIVRGNAQNGIALSDTSTASFGPNANQITGNGGWGVFCAGPPGVAQLAGDSLNWVNASGNASGQVSCPTAGPPFATVDCAAGQTVAAALASAPASGHFTIAIKGTCTERVNIRRDDTTIEGVAPGATLAAPSPGSAVVTIQSAEEIRLANLTISGGGGGITAFSRAGFTTDNVRLTGFSNSGISIGAQSNGHMNNTTVEGGDSGISVNAVSNASITGGTISGARVFNVSASNGSTVFIGGGTLVTGAGFHGVHASNGGSVNVGNATIQNSAGTGLFAFQGGNVSTGPGSLIQGNSQGGVGANAATAVVGGGRVTDNAPFGVLAYNGGVLTIQGGAIIEANRGSGVHLNVASSLAIQDATVRNNTGSGIEVNDTGVVGGQGNTITGNSGWGVRCSGPPSVAMISTGPGGLGDLSNNGAGTENCPNA